MTEMNKNLYEYMQQYDTTEHMMGGMLCMLRATPNIDHTTVAESMHVLCEAGQVCYKLCFSLVFLTWRCVC